MIKKMLAGAVLSASVVFGSASALAQYPERNIQAVVPWGAGGATDTVARSLLPLVEKELGRSLIVSNRPGGTGVIGTRYAMQQKPDGYTVLIAAENAQLYPLLGLADFDYNAFELINLIGQNVGVIATHKDSPYNTLSDLLADAEAKPGQLRMGSSGVGSLTDNVRAMVATLKPLDVRQVTFGGDGPGVTALIGKHIDFMPLSLAAVREPISSGRLKGLTIVAAERHPDLPNVPAITETLPGMADYLPWGPFWGVWVHKDTPDEAKQRLRDAFAKVVGGEAGQQTLKRLGATPLNLQGAEAKAYLDRWQSVTAWSIYNAGAATTSPESLGIAKP